MTTFLCITDFSSSSENAIKYAGELAQFFKARILLFHTILAPAPANAAFERDYPHEMLQIELEDRMEYVERLEALRKRLVYNDTSGQVKYETYLMHGLAKDTIPAIIETEQVDMVIIGNDEANSLRDVLVGTVAEGLLEKITCPTLIVPQRAPFHPLRKIVVASDLEKTPYTGIDVLLQMSSFFSSELMLLHILPEATNEFQSFVKTDLAEYYSIFPYKNISVHVEVNTSIEEGLSQYIRQNRADMLVLGYHAGEEWQHLLPQHQTQELSYHTYLPLLILHYSL